MIKLYNYDKQTLEFKRILELDTLPDKYEFCTLTEPPVYTPATQYLTYNKEKDNWNIVNIDMDSAEEILSELKDSKIQMLKDEGRRRIQTIGVKYYTNEYWLLKSQNFQDDKSKYLAKLTAGQTPTQTEIDKFQFATDVLNRKDRYVDRINEIEEQILNEYTSEETINLDVTDDNLWAGLD